MNEKISAGVNFPQDEVEVDSGSMRSSTSFFLEILGSLCLDILGGIVLDWICPFEWEIASAEVQPGIADDPAFDVCSAFDQDIVASLREAL